MKMDIDMKARLLFIAFLLILATGALIWYLLAATHYKTYQIYTKDSVSGLIVDAPIEFHGVEVGKVKSIKLIEPQLVGIVLNVEKDAPVSSATVATIISRGVAARGFTGYVYVSLEDAGTVASPLTAKPGEPYPVIPTAPTKQVTLDTAVNQVNANVQATTDLMRSVLDKKSVTSLAAIHRQSSASQQDAGGQFGEIGFDHHCDRARQSSHRTAAGVEPECSELRAGRQPPGGAFARIWPEHRKVAAERQRAPRCHSCNRARGR